MIRTIALLQTNPVVGDVAANARRVQATYEQAASRGAQLCVATELVLMGYPPRDLLYLASLLDQCDKAVQDLAALTRTGPPLILGAPTRMPNRPGKPLANAALVLMDGNLAATYHKRLLPTYDIFDESRYFEPGQTPCVVDIHGLRVAVTVCEDIWNDAEFWKQQLYVQDPLQSLPSLDADLLVNISASPFALAKQLKREDMLRAIAVKYGLAVAYANQVGGNDELVFDGRSCLMDAEGRLTARGKPFREDVVLADLRTPASAPAIASPDLDEETEAWQALVLGLSDYLAKTGFSRALVGLSGGVDSSLTAAVAAKALGPDNVLGVLMPSPYTSRASIDDALALAKNLAIDTLTLPIQDLMNAFDATLAQAFQDLPRDVTEENIQARIRGNLLMALSNKYNSLLLTTGNKSELAVGYCTIYGDLSGGLAVISDVPKTLVYRLCAWLNASNILGPEPIPPRVLTKPPSAELRPGQQDADSLPPYDILDPILHLLVERQTPPDAITRLGFDRDTVNRVFHLVNTSEFKRRQAPPGIKISSRAFGTGWRMPIAKRIRLGEGEAVPPAARRTLPL